MFIETVQGYGGIIQMPQGYLKGAADKVHVAGGLLILDAVQPGPNALDRNFADLEIAKVE